LTYLATYPAPKRLPDEPLPANLINQHTTSGKTSVPSVILTPVAVTKANVASTVIKDGFIKSSQLCAGKYAQACKDAGIQTN